ncbi:Peroxisome chaperone and import receptor [Puccinia graminis f. sp. tritici]|uniref:Peroxisome chaperone and import receptor n=1 Tax=Puccinia graminis f. sp. tritici TaxID=56615 RepID=A0A5B0PYA5_PUCGR|nr:Peroxisome chaperone and import receptor [Puccinia graminis f. sp. tritici]
MSTEKTMINGVSIEDDMEDDFDDLLDKFKAPTETKKEEPSLPKEKASEGAKPDSSITEEWPNQEISDEFARDLAEGMEALLAGMKDEDGGEFKKHLEALVSADGGGLKGATDLLEALNQNDPNPNQQSSSSSSNLPEHESKNFQEAIQETMEKLKRSDDSAKAKSGPSGAGEEDEKLSALFEKMMSGENGLPDETQLQTILQSFMEELMSKEIMYEPLKDMNRLFPDWIEENRSKLSPEDMKRYETQAKIIEQVIERFEDPSWDSEEKAGGDRFLSRQKEVIELLTKMQDCGPPPKEILGDMPPGKPPLSASSVRTKSNETVF